MNEVQGRVVSLISAGRERRALLEVDAAVACARCAAGKGCGAGVFAGRRRHIDAAIPCGVQLRPGQTVSVSLGPGRVLRAALLVYGLPLGGAVIGATIAWRLGFGDGPAALAAIAGLSAGWLACRRQLGRNDCLRNFRPIVTTTASAAGRH